MTTRTYTVTGMSCSHRVRAVTAEDAVVREAVEEAGYEVVA